jgi:hypothetical protein
MCIPYGKKKGKVGRKEKKSRMKGKQEEKTEKKEKGRVM